MGVDHEVLARALALAGLIGSTITYCHIVLRRVELRRQQDAQCAVEASGLVGMVRLILADPDPR